VVKKTRGIFGRIIGMNTHIIFSGLLGCALAMTWQQSHGLAQTLAQAFYEPRSRSLEPFTIMKFKKFY